MSFQLPTLKYDYKDLEPYIDALTMEIHHTKHHGAYTNNLNAAIDGTSISTLPIEEILKDISKHSPAVRNNGGGYYNHNLFWELMSPNGGGEPSGELLKQIQKTFGSFGEFKEKFSATATTRFGSGWAWLVIDKLIKLVFNFNWSKTYIKSLSAEQLKTISNWFHEYS